MGRNSERAKKLRIILREVLGMENSEHEMFSGAFLFASSNRNAKKVDYPLLTIDLQVDNSFVFIRPWQIVYPYPMIQMKK